MTSYTPSLRLILADQGSAVNTWGTLLNTSLINLVDSAISGYIIINMSDADYTLSTSNGAGDQARSAFLGFTGTLTANRNIIAPGVSKEYIIINATTGGFSLTIKTASGSGLTIPNGYRAKVFTDGTTFYDSITYHANLAVGTFGATTGTFSGTATFTGEAILQGTADVTSIAALGFGLRVRQTASAGNAVIQFTDYTSGSGRGVIAADTSGNIYIQPNGGIASITGALSTNGTITSLSYVQVSGNSGTNRNLYLTTAGSGVRWGLIANATAESGSNAGSDFNIGRFNDAGTYIDSPIFITRSTGAVSLSSSLFVTGSISTSSTLSASSFSGNVTGNLTGNVTSSGTSTFSTVSVGALTASTTMQINNASALQWYSSAQSADQKYWRISQNAATLIFDATNDAYNSANAWLTVTRSGYAISSVNFPNGTVTVSNQLTMSGPIVSSSTGEFANNNAGGYGVRIKQQPSTTGNAVLQFTNNPVSTQLAAIYADNSSNLTIQPGGGLTTVLGALNVSSTLSVTGTLSAINYNAIAGNFLINNSTAADAGTIGFNTSNGPAIQFWGTSTGGAGQLAFLTAGVTRAVMLNSGEFYANVNAGPTSAYGYGFRGAPQNYQAGNYTLALTDSGLHIWCANAGAQTITIPTNASVAFPVGTTIVIMNLAGSNSVTIGVAGGVGLYWVGTANTGNRTLATKGMCTLIKGATDTWAISGAGIS